MQSTSSTTTSSSSFRSGKNLDPSQPPPTTSPSPSSSSSPSPSSSADINIGQQQQQQQQQPHRCHCCCYCCGCQPLDCDATESLVDESGEHPSEQNPIEQPSDEDQTDSNISTLLACAVTIFAGQSSSTVLEFDTSYITIIILVAILIRQLLIVVELFLDDANDSTESFELMDNSEDGTIDDDDDDDEGDDDVEEEDDDQMKRSVSSSSSLMVATKRASTCCFCSHYCSTRNILDINDDDVDERISYQNMELLEHLDDEEDYDGGDFHHHYDDDLDDHDQDLDHYESTTNSSGRCLSPPNPDPNPVMPVSQSSKNVINIEKILLLLILELNKMNNDDEDPYNHDDDPHDDQDSDDGAIAGAGMKQLEEAAAAKNPIKPTTTRMKIRMSPRPSSSSSSSDRLVKFVIIMMTILAAIDRFDVCDAKVKIHQIIVPKFIENGTMDSVSLDCQYSLDPEEDHNLVVKWFFREDPEPIYQWIVEHDLRRVPQRYQGRVNPDYQVANVSEPWQRYRSLNLIRPTVEMTGRYSCHVISITSEAHDADTMIVFARAKSINLVTRRVTRVLNITGIGSKTSGSFPFTANRHKPPNYTDVLSRAIQSNRQHQSDYPGPQNGGGPGGWPPPSSSSSTSSAAGLSSSRLFDGSGGRSTMEPPLSSFRAKVDQYKTGKTIIHYDANRPPTVSETEIECTVENVYPLPELTIYQVIGDGPNTQHPRSLERARVYQNSTRLPNGAFRVTMILSIDDDDLLNMSNGGNGDPNGVGHPNNDHHHNHHQQQPKYHQNRVSSTTSQRPSSSSASSPMTKPTMFECLVAQDELKHELRKSTLFVPNIAQSWNESNNNNGQSTIGWNQTWILLYWTIILILR